MLLKDLLEGVGVTFRGVREDAEITGVSYDTREIEKGALFVALPGYKTDGQRYVAEALEKGAAGVVCRQRPAEEGPWIVTGEPRKALAKMACNWFGHPGRELSVVGVTGTNGKTTVTYLIKTMLEQTLGARVGLIGTNQNMIGERALPAERTTPESWQVQHLLRQMAEEGCTWAVMEVSSHALALDRVEGIPFRCGVFTNLTRDHLDFHGTMENYRGAKERLLSQSGVAVLNLEDEAGRYYAGRVPCRAVTYAGEGRKADLVCRQVSLFPDRVWFEAVTAAGSCPVDLPIPGRFSVSNAMACLACGLALGIPPERSAAALGRAKGVKGRIEVVPGPVGYTVIIDYAHSPDALENILTALRGITRGRLICLFGCGGDRDRGKRPRMGEIACRLADLVLFTSDNPRSEDPEEILAEILKGAAGTRTPYRVEPDRRKAIRLALAMALPGDVVLLAGKGHETWQEVAGKKYHLDEREEVSAWLRRASGAQKGEKRPRAE